ncbi:hypothetical protein B296_00017541 [Ensete ventricosum]|uniref:Peptidase A1 domain-containing protein n=1 Tax=Ensete ventricosum TaxID=4639 RepID=A0A427AGW7_ENSVE|nr:hypothetical protein B296_00017541 [Ensete ventricosum]
MGGWKAARRGLLFASLVAAAAIASVSAAVTTPSPKKAKAVDASSAVFPIYGDVYRHGYISRTGLRQIYAFLYLILCRTRRLYYVEMNIGDPPKPYFLDVDTGSDLTWIQCDAPCVRCSKVESFPILFLWIRRLQGPHPWYRPKRTNLVPCRNRLCAALHSGTAQDQNCGQCDYEIEYTDHGSSLGVLVADAFSLGRTLARPILAFGCGYNQQLTSPNTPALTDGVLGLGTGKVSVLSQLSDQGATKNVVGHCLSTKGGGDQRFEVLQVKSDLSKTPLKEVFDDPSLAVCWRGQKPFKSVNDVKQYFKTLALSFVNPQRTSLEVPPENYLIVTVSITTLSLPSLLNWTTETGKVELLDSVVLDRRNMGMRAWEFSTAPKSDSEISMSSEVHGS